MKLLVERIEARRIPILFFLLIVAALLRLYDLNDGLWHDEIITAVKYVRLPFAKILTTYDSENEHFLYTILARGFVLLFEENAWALRFPAVLFGIASIGTTYLLGRQVSNVLEALLASALLTFSYYHIWFSQNARGYTGLLFFANLSSWLLIRALVENRSKL